MPCSSYRSMQSDLQIAVVSAINSSCLFSRDPKTSPAFSDFIFWGYFSIIMFRESSICSMGSFSSVCWVKKRLLSVLKFFTSGSRGIFSS